MFSFKTMNTDFIKRPSFILKVYLYLTGLAIVSVYIFYVNKLTCEPHKGLKLCKARISLLSVAGLGYPLWILPCLLIAFIVDKDFHRSIINPLLAFGGFVSSLAGGAMTLQEDHHENGLKGLGSLFILTGVVHLADCVLYFFLKNRK